MSLVINLPAFFTGPLLIQNLPALRVLRRTVTCGIRRDDGPWIIDALKHVDRNHVPAAREIRVAVEGDTIRLVRV